MTAEEFLKTFEDFSTLDPAVIQSHIDFVDRNYCLAAHWTKNPNARKDAIFLLAAHFGYLRWMQSAQVFSASLAAASGTTPSALQPTDDHYKLTLYGQQYLDLRKRISPPHTGFAFG